ncbi:MAG: GNAT family N-acetyltransferase [Myxococcales bacterium]|jgi:predicted GNAT family N-acyltransferase
MASEQQPEIRIETAKGPGDLASAMAIREIVFIEEQQVPPDLERDDEDSTAFHALAYLGGHAIGTGRLVELDAPPHGESGRWGRVGRMAVLESYRRRGIGRLILEWLEREAERRGLEGLMLHAQVYVQDFYARRGYRQTGAVFDEAGIPHIEMRKHLGRAQSP